MVDLGANIVTYCLEKGMIMELRHMGRFSLVWGLFERVHEHKYSRLTVNNITPFWD